MAISKTIRNFPIPYPGECLYSLFSRYHARSGNVSFQNTAEDLFGNPMYAFHSSVTTPYRLEFVQRWYPQDAETIAKKLLLYHTGFQYYCLVCRPERKEKYYEAFCQGTAESYKPAVHMAREISCFFHHLRYCPMCVKEEMELYGEPYWSVIAQIDGVDFCPVHGCHLCDSSVSRNDIRSSLIPASQVLSSQELAQERPAYAYTELDCESLAFSRDVCWFLNHGAILDYNTIKRLTSNAFYRQGKDIHYGAFYARRELLMYRTSAAFKKKMEVIYITRYNLKRDDIDSNNSFPFYSGFLPTWILTIHYLFGDTENFGKAVIADTMNIGENSLDNNFNLYC